MLSPPINPRAAKRTGSRKSPNTQTTLSQPTCTDNPLAASWKPDCPLLSQQETLFIRRLNASLLSPPPCYLPARLPGGPSKTLVLDLDETLLHCSLKPDFPYQKELQVSIEGHTGKVYCGRRPSLQAFLEAMAPLFELIAFTASATEYANAVLDWADPHHLIKLRLSRPHCTVVEGVLVKDLRVLGRNLNEVVILENSVYAFGLQLENGVPVRSWQGAAEDCELEDLLPRLRVLAQTPDVQKSLEECLHLRRLILSC